MKKYRILTIKLIILASFLCLGCLPEKPKSQVIPKELTVSTKANTLPRSSAKSNQNDKYKKYKSDKTSSCEDKGPGHECEKGAR